MFNDEFGTLKQQIEYIIVKVALSPAPYVTYRYENTTRCTVCFCYSSNISISIRNDTALPIVEWYIETSCPGSQSNSYNYGAISSGSLNAQIYTEETCGGALDVFVNLPLPQSYSFTATFYDTNNPSNKDVHNPIYGGSWFCISLNTSLSGNIETGTYYLALVDREIY